MNVDAIFQTVRSSSFIYTLLHPTYITYRSLYAFFILVLLVRVPNFIWLNHVIFVLHDFDHPACINYRSLHYKLIFNSVL